MVSGSSRPPPIFLSTPSARRATICWPATPFARTNFYPRPPRGGRPDHLAGAREVGVFLSTPSARRATSDWHESQIFVAISIHALREEGDQGLRNPQHIFCISIHALREEGDLQRVQHSDRPGNFYPRPPRGGRRPDRAGAALPGHISIHALREEGDTFTSIFTASMT